MLLVCKKLILVPVIKRLLFKNYCLGIEGDWLAL